MQLTLSAMLQSPQFLYRAEPQPAGRSRRHDRRRSSRTRWRAASRSSCGRACPTTRSSTPRRAAQLSTEDSSARRPSACSMTIARAACSGAFIASGSASIASSSTSTRSNARRRPAVDAAVAPLRGSARRSSSSRTCSPAGGTLRDLLTSRRAWVDGEMARIYGLAAPADRRAWDESSSPSERAGLLTRVAFLAGYVASRRDVAAGPWQRGAPSHALPAAGLAAARRRSLEADRAAEQRAADQRACSSKRAPRPRSARPATQSLNGFGFGFESFDAAGALPARSRARLPDRRERRPSSAPTSTVRSTARSQLSRTLDRSADVFNAAPRAQWLRYAARARAVDAAEQPLVDALDERVHGERRRRARAPRRRSSRRPASAIARWRTP